MKPAQADEPKKAIAKPAETKHEDHKTKYMQPSYQSSNFDKRSSGQSPTHSLHRSRSANRYTALEEEEDNVSSPDLLLAAQIDTEGDLERELNTLNLDVSVHSEY